MRSSFFPKPSSFLTLSALIFVFGFLAQAQTLILVSGNGQVVSPSGPSPQRLTVQLLDAAGRPFPGQIVTFTDTLSGAGGNVNGSPFPTDANGITSVQFTGANINSTITSAPFVQTQVRASFPGAQDVVFNLTTSSAGPGGGTQVQAAVISPVFGQSLSGTAGSTGTTPIKVFVGTISSNGGVPNVAVSIVSDPGGASLTCAEGPNLQTDLSGTATCTPIFNKLGNGTFSVIVGGGFSTFSQFQFTVTVGPPAIIRLDSGDNQAGAPGDRLPIPIRATVTDLAGNPIVTGVAIVFESVTPGAVTFTNVRTVSDNTGAVSANVILGNIPGPQMIRIRDAANTIANPALVTVRVNGPSISGLTIVSGGGQTAFINAAFGAPLVVRVTNAAGAPVTSATVTFAVTAGAASLSPTTALTDANGNASTTVTAGATAGAITVVASTSGLTQTFTLTANPPGPINFNYLNGASFESGRISPGSIVTINAQGLVNANVQGIVGGTLVGVLPYTVAGVSVTIGGLPAPIFYVGNQNGQQSVTVQVPFEVPATTVPITIAVAGGGSTSAFVTLLPYAPGLFESITPSDSRRRVVALRPNGTVVTPANPAGRGENIRVYLTGLGNVSPLVPTGTFSPAGPDPIVTSNLVVGVNNNGVPLVQAVYARNLIGVYELTFTVPTDTVAFPSGTVNFSVAVQGPNGFVYSQPSFIAIQ